MRLTAWSAMKYRMGIEFSFNFRPTTGCCRNDFLRRQRICGADTCESAGWRVPTAGEIVGVSYDGDAANLDSGEICGRNRQRERGAGAGRRVGRAWTFALPSKGGNDVGDAVEVGFKGFYELDSRELGDRQLYPRPFYRPGPLKENTTDEYEDGDVRFLSAVAPRLGDVRERAQNRCGRNVAGVGGGFAGKRRCDGGGSYPVPPIRRRHSR